jgi:endo-1,4-beta-mannosidase
MYKSARHYFNSIGILVSERFGFGRDLYTNKTTYRFTNEILQALSNKSDAVMFCDLAKAFYCVNHSLLMK